MLIDAVPIIEKKIFNANYNDKISDEVFILWIFRK